MPWKINTQLLIFYTRTLTKMNIDDQKVQGADEMKLDIWKYLVSSDVADNAWYIYACYISSCLK